MRRILALHFAFCFFALAGSSLWAADGLFSEVPINSVFARPGAVSGSPVGPSVAPAVPQVPTASPSGSGLLDALKAAGFEPRQASENIVQTKVILDKWSFPVLIASDPQKEELTVTLLLSTVKDEQQLPASKLLELLDASRQHSPAFFAYSSKRKRIELYRTLSSGAPSAEVLKAEINRLAAIAKGTESLWNLASTSTPKPVATSPATAPQASPALPSLAGKWSAVRSEKEAFALLLSAEGKYALVHVSQGKQTKSTGTYKVAGSQLTLAGSDGTTIAGTLSSASQQQFVFTPQGSKSALTFKRAS